MSYCRASHGSEHMSVQPGPWGWACAGNVGGFWVELSDHFAWCTLHTSGLACCSLWDRKKLDTTGWLNYSKNSACRLNGQGDNIQSCRPPVSIWNQSVVPCLVLTVASWLGYKFLRRQVRCLYSHLFKNFPQFVVVHTVQGFSVFKETEVDFF